MATPRETTQHPHGVAGTAARKWEHVPTLDLLHAIKNGQAEPQQLAATDRRRCVEVIHASGRSVAEIAKVLDVSDRTIKRDLALLRKVQAQRLTSQSIDERRGASQHRADAAIQALLVLANGKEPPARERVQALTSVALMERAEVRHLDALELERLRLGVGKDVENVSDTGQLVDFDHIQAELDRLRVVDQKMNRVSPSPPKRQGDSTSDVVTDPSEEAA